MRGCSPWSPTAGTGTTASRGPGWAGCWRASPSSHRPSPVTSLRQGTRANALRSGRYCYDHLAGQLGVSIMRSLLDRRVLIGGDGHFDRAHRITDRLSAAGHDLDYRLTAEGEAWVRWFGIDLEALRAHRRPLIRYCTDWTEQQHHLAGALGAALSEAMVQRGWIERAHRGRAVTLADAGRRGLHEYLDVEVPAPVAAERPRATARGRRGRSRRDRRDR